MDLFKSEHLEAVCPSCRTDRQRKWFSEWWKHNHYMTALCDCGYKIHRKTDHFHSGHH